ncbi:GNAT family N-acetyltransferase [Bacteroidota bacterium]
MIIRKATEKDSEKVALVLFTSGLAKSLVIGREMFLREMKRGDTYLLAEEEKPLGIASWIFQGAYRHELAELYHIGLIPEAKGKGVGKELLKAMIKDINKVYAVKGKKLRKLYALTHAENEIAHKFYRKMGMVHEATLKDHFYKGKDEFVFAYYP